MRCKFCVFVNSNCVFYSSLRTHFEYHHFLLFRSEKHLGLKAAIIISIRLRFGSVTYWLHWTIGSTLAIWVIVIGNSMHMRLLNEMENVNYQTHTFHEVQFTYPCHSRWFWLITLLLFSIRTIFLPRRMQKMYCRNDFGDVL